MNTKQEKRKRWKTVKTYRLVKRSEYNALVRVARAAKRFQAYYFEDLAKSNKGFLSKLVLQNYQEMMAVSIDLPHAISNLEGINPSILSERLLVVR